MNWISAVISRPVVNLPDSFWLLSSWRLAIAWLISRDCFSINNCRSKASLWIALDSFAPPSGSCVVAASNCRSFCSWVSSNFCRSKSWAWRVLSADLCLASSAILWASCCLVISDSIPTVSDRNFFLCCNISISWEIFLPSVVCPDLISSSLRVLSDCSWLIVCSILRYSRANC